MIFYTSLSYKFTNEEGLDSTGKLLGKFSFVFFAFISLFTEFYFGVTSPLYIENLRY